MNLTKEIQNSVKVEKFDKGFIFTTYDGSIIKISSTLITRSSSFGFQIMPASKELSVGLTLLIERYL